MPLNNIASELLRKMKKGRDTITDDENSRRLDPIAYDREYPSNWKSFSHDPMSPKVKIRRLRGIRAKHEI